MGKKIISLLISILIVSGLSMTAFASKDIVKDVSTHNTEYFEDGSSLEIVLQEGSRTFGKTFNAHAKKTLTFRDNDGNKMWQVDLNATFKVNEGVSVSCTAVSFGAPTIYNSTWRYITNTTSKSGNKASGTITMKKYFMGLPVRTETPTVTITCDKYGNLS